MRVLRIKLKENKHIDLELVKAVEVTTSVKQMIHADQLADGKWRLIYSGNLIPDFSLVEGFEVIRKS